MSNFVENIMRKRNSGFVGGLYKGAASTAAGFSTLGQKTLGAIANPVVKSLSGQGVDTPTINQSLGDTLKPISTSEKLGFAAERVAEFLIPSSKLVSAEKTAASAIQGTSRLSSLARLGSRSAIEAAYNGGLTAAQQGTFRQDAKTAALVSALFPLAGGLYSGVKSKLGQKVSQAGEDLLFKKIKPSYGDIEEGFDVGNLKKYGLAKGNLNQILTSVNNKIHGWYDEMTNVLQRRSNPEYSVPINLNDVFNKTVQSIGQKQAGNFGNLGSLKRVLGGLRNEIAYSSKDGLVDPLTAQMIKQGAGTKGAWTFGFVDPDASAIEKVYNTFYRQMKQELEKVGGPKIKQLNKQISDLLPIKYAILKRIPVEDRQNVLSLTDSLSLFGSILNPKALAILGANRISKNARFANFLIRAGENMANGEARTSVGKRIFGTKVQKEAKPALNDFSELLLPSGQGSYPQSQINVPLETGAKSASTLLREETQNLQPRQVFRRGNPLFRKLKK